LIRFANGVFPPAWQRLLPQSNPHYSVLLGKFTPRTGRITATAFEIWKIARRFLQNVEFFITNCSHLSGIL